MSKTDWTKKDVKALKNLAGTMSGFEIAKILSRTIVSVENKARRLGVSLKVVPSQTTLNYNLSSERCVRKAAELSEAANYIRETQKLFMNYKIPYVKPPKKKKCQQEEDVLLLWSDMHTGMVNRAPGSNLITYNDEIRKIELNNLYRGVLRLKELYEPNIKLRKLYIASLGDNATNDRIFDGQQFEISMPMGEQLMEYKLDKTWFILKMLEIFDEVEDIEICGNHGRTTTNRTAEPVQNNFEWLLGKQLQEKFADVKRVKIVVPNDYCYTLDIRGHKYLLQHGHEFRGCASTSIERAAKDIVTLGGKEMQHDVICIGHFHEVNKKQIGVNSTLLINGCWIYKDSYAYHRLRKFSTAKQLFIRVSNKCPISGYNEIDLLWGHKFKK